MSTQLPAHLLALFQNNPDLVKVGENIKSEGANAKVRFGGKKWKLISATGEETVVPPFFLTDAAGVPISPPQVINGIDVIVVDVNENKTHIVYEKAFVEGEEIAPLWSSDDGTPVPVEHENKVVSDYRRIAVLWANNVEQGLFELRIASKSLTPFAKYRTAIGNAGLPIGAIVTRITFNEAFDYPVLEFTPTAYLSEAQGAALGEAATTHKDQVKFLIGLGKKKDAAIAAPAVQAALPAPAVEAPKATRKKKEPEAIAVQVVLPTPVVTQVGLGPITVSPPTAAAAVVTKPQAASAELDSLLANIMGK